jgi:hypothetical protein
LIKTNRPLRLEVRPLPSPFLKQKGQGAEEKKTSEKKKISPI